MRTVFDKVSRIVFFIGSQIAPCAGSLVADNIRNPKPWSYYRDLEVSLWHGNEMTGAGGVQEFIQSLDSTLFQYDMRAWYFMQQHIRNHAESFKFFKMDTSGHRGFMMICKSCTRVCKISWQKKGVKWDDDVLEENRVLLRDFLGFGTRSDKKRQRMV